MNSAASTGAPAFVAMAQYRPSPARSPAAGAPTSTMPGVARISVACVQPMGVRLVEAASARMAVAPLGAGRSRPATASQMPRSRSTLAKWMPAVACSGSGKWIASAAQQRRAQAAGVAERRAGHRRCAPRRRLRPCRDPAAEPPRHGRSCASPSISARLRITRSAGSPASRRSRIAPTAPKRAVDRAAGRGLEGGPQRLDQALGGAAAQDR